ncbi:MAG: peptide chain release factor 2 [Elusimicrobia bacterium]|nr:peptide chain release factor 2 [Elusimicrobiota bacterium]
MEENRMAKLQELTEKLATIGRLLDIPGKAQVIQQLEGKTTQADFWSTPQEAQTTLKTLTGLRATVEHWEALKGEVNHLRELLELSNHEQETSLLPEIDQRLLGVMQSVHQLEIQAKFTGPHDDYPAIVTLHAGAGGTESCDWVERLLRMYRRWAERHDRSVEITDILPGEGVGVKSVTCVIGGPFAYGSLKGEIGVHRLVRISPFDANKRRHTSFASCDIIPEIEDATVADIQESDLRIDTYRASGHGGQHVNKTDSAVRITHLPSSLVVQCQNERSQYKNKQMALKILRARLYELEQEKKRAALEKHYTEKGEIAWGNQIRSYVFMPYQLVKDHRTGYETSQVESVLDGALDPFIEAYLAHQVTTGRREP